MKKSGRDEPVWVAIHKCMEAMLGISLYSCLYPKLAKICLSYYLLCFLFNKIKEEGRQVLPRSRGFGDVGDGGRWHNQCTHM
jgi:hypothetical protein